MSNTYWKNALWFSFACQSCSSVRKLVYIIFAWRVITFIFSIYQLLSWMPQSQGGSYSGFYVKCYWQDALRFPFVCQSNILVRNQVWIIFAWRTFIVINLNCCLWISPELLNRLFDLKSTTLLCLTANPPFCPPPPSVI